jgi:hypothetical protein
MAIAAPILFGGSLAEALGIAGAGAAGAAAIAGLLSGFRPQINTRFINIPQGPGSGELVPDTPVGQKTVSNARSLSTRLRSISRRLGPFAADIVKDIVREVTEKAVTTPFALAALTDALGYWITSDLVARSTFHSDLHIPTRDTFTTTVDMVADTIGALMLVDIVSGRDVGSDIAESIIEGFNESIVGDAIRAYLDTVSGVEAVDDDEIRDVVGEGALGTAEELAYLGARSGLDTFSAMSELYTGLLQGDNTYWNRATRELDDIMKRWERGLAPDVWIMGSVIERLGEDLADAMYWYLSPFDYVENRIKILMRDLIQAYAAYRSGGLSESDMKVFIDGAFNELSAIWEALSVFNDDQFLESYVNKIVEEYTAFRNQVPYEALYRSMEKILEDAGRRMAGYADLMRDVYRNMKKIRSVSVVSE